MPRRRPISRSVVGGAAKRVPGLRRLPVGVLIGSAQVALIARAHLLKLEAEERRRLLQLMRHAHGRPSNLSHSERDELAELVAKMEPRLFAGQAVQRLSPVPLPRRVLYGSRRPQR